MIYRRGKGGDGRGERVEGASPFEFPPQNVKTYSKGIPIQLHKGQRHTLLAVTLMRPTNDDQIVIIAGREGHGRGAGSTGGGTGPGAD